MCILYVKSDYKLQHWRNSYGQNLLCLTCLLTVFQRNGGPVRHRREGDPLPLRCQSITQKGYIPVHTTQQFRKRQSSRLAVLYCILFKVVVQRSGKYQPAGSSHRCWLVEKVVIFFATYIVVPYCIWCTYSTNLHQKENNSLEQIKNMEKKSSDFIESMKDIENNIIQ